jgi:hypothetical protein
LVKKNYCKQCSWCQDEENEELVLRDSILIRKWQAEDITSEIAGNHILGIRRMKSGYITQEYFNPYSGTSA